MAISKSAADEIHAMTGAEIARQLTDYSMRRRAAVSENAALYAAHLKGEITASAPMSDIERAKRERAKSIANGHAPAWLTPPKATPRLQELEIEIGALDILIHALGQSEIAVKAAEAVVWAETHRDEWRALARDILLAALKLKALELRATAMTDELRGACVALPLARWVGSGNSIVGADWSADPLMDPLNAALDDGIITQADIRGAKNVR